jgi:hypothetical protein
MPFCKDCLHCLPDADSVRPYDNARCERLTDPDPVAGGERLGFCRDERGLLGRCKSTGIHFVPADAIAKGFEEADATIGATALSG